jgi:hypothetical protein
MLLEPDRFAVLLRSPAFLQALCFALLYSTQAHLAFQEAQAGAAGSSSSSRARTRDSSSSSRARTRDSSSSSTLRGQGSGKSSSSKKASKGDSSSSKGSSAASSSQQQQQQQDGSTWVRAGHRAQQLQASEQQLLRALGCSGRALVWCALDQAENGVSMSTVKLFALTTAYEQIADLTTDRFSIIPPPLPAALESGQLHQLLPGLLLHCVAALPRYDADGITCASWRATGKRQRWR